MTTIPSRSHASSIALLIGWCALRNGVEPGRLEQLDPAFLGPTDGGRADDAVVVVHARAPQLDGLPVDAEASRHVQPEGPDAEALLGPVGLSPSSKRTVRQV